MRRGNFWLSAAIYKIERDCVVTVALEFQQSFRTCLGGADENGFEFDWRFSRRFDCAAQKRNHEKASKRAIATLLAHRATCPDTRRPRRTSCIERFSPTEA